MQVDRPSFFDKKRDNRPSQRLGAVTHWLVIHSFFCIRPARFRAVSALLTVIEQHVPASERHTRSKESGGSRYGKHGQVTV